MRLITKQEAFHLREQGLENYVKHSYSRNKKYYAVEHPKCLSELEKYREERTLNNK